MKRDLLAEATRALRESAEAPPAPVDETRARVMVTLRKERARRIPLVRMLIPLAAVLVGSMAWAASGGRLPTSFRDVLPGFAQEPRASDTPPSLPPLPSSAPPRTPTAPLEAEEKALEAPSERESMAAPNSAPPPSAARPIGTLTPEPRAALSIPPPLAAPAQIPAPTVTTTPTVATAPTVLAAPTAPTAEKPATPTPAELDEQALYTTAHRHHFVERNPGAALAAWDTYLRAAPRGRLAVEARYNRALCLVRLGRAREAEAALEGFARGAYGGYRQAEARTLLDAMRGASP